MRLPQMGIIYKEILTKELQSVIMNIAIGKPTYLERWRERPDEARQPAKSMVLIPSGN